MRELKINNETVLLDDEDFEKYKHLPWTIGHNGYVEYKYDDNGTTIVVRLHQLVSNSDKTCEDVDHKDRNKFNNQKDNLRKCSRIENSFNRPKPYQTTTKFKGVYFNKQIGKWIGNINYKYKTIYLVSSESELDCAYAYNIAAQLLVKEFAYLNDIGEYQNESVRKSVLSKLSKYVTTS